MGCTTGDCAIRLSQAYGGRAMVGTPLTIITNYGTPVPGGWPLIPYKECTLSFMAVQKSTNNLVGITVGDLLTLNPTITRDRTDPQNTISPTDSFKYPFSYIYGPYSPDGGNAVANFGITSTYNPLYTSPVGGTPVYNQVNAGMIYPYAYDAQDPTNPQNLSRVVSGDDFLASWKLIYVSSGATFQLSEAMPFATTIEIDAITTSTQIFIAGYNQLKKGDCGVQINSVNDTQVFTFDNATGIFSFNHLLSFTRINPSCGDPVIAQDKGACIAAFINGAWKIIGIVIGFNGSTGYGSRIDYIADQLDIEAWDGSLKGFTSLANLQFSGSFGTVVPNIKFTTTSGLNTIKSFTQNNVVYKQIGTTALTL